VDDLSSPPKNTHPLSPPGPGPPWCYIASISIAPALLLSAAATHVRDPGLAAIYGVPAGILAWGWPNRG
jgi:hypothetical protein